MEMFKRKFPENSALPSLPFIDQQGYTAINGTNKLVIHVNNIGTLQRLPVTDTMDPYGYLREAMGDRYVHMEDNHIYCDTEFLDVTTSKIRSVLTRYNQNLL